MFDKLIEKIESEYVDIYIPYILTYLDTKLDQEFDISLCDLDEIDNDEECEFVYSLLSEIETISENGKKELKNAPNNSVLIGDYIIVYEENFNNSLIKETRKNINFIQSKNVASLLDIALNTFLAYTDIFMYDKFVLEAYGNKYHYDSEGYDVVQDNYGFLLFKKEN